VPATPSLKVVKAFTFQGSIKAYSNRYHFNGGTPADNTHWTTLADAVVAAEKAMHEGGVEITDVWGYAAGSDVPVFHKTYTQFGTGSFASAAGTQGFSAALVRYSTTARTSKNHPIYLFNYYHGVATGGFSDNDHLNAAQKTAIETYAAAWISGFSDGTNTLVRAGPNGATATSRFVDPYLTHRDFPR